MRRWPLITATTLLGAMAGAVAGYICLLRPWHLRWGATDEEVGAPLPGDHYVPHADLTATRAITVKASPAEVWPWIAQLGQEQGGFYTYDTLENLIGCNIHNADRVVPEWQVCTPGDQVKLHPDVPLEVVLVEPEEALVLRGGVPLGESAPPYDFTWAFVLRGQPDGTTRLLVRERYGYTKRWAQLLVEPVEAISFLMSQKMLRGMKARAEGNTAAVSASVFDRAD